MFGTITIGRYTLEQYKGITSPDSGTRIREDWTDSTVNFTKRFSGGRARHFARCVPL